MQKILESLYDYNNEAAQAVFKDLEKWIITVERSGFTSSDPTPLSDFNLEYDHAEGSTVRVNAFANGLYNIIPSKTTKAFVEKQLKSAFKSFFEHKSGKDELVTAMSMLYDRIATCILQLRQACQDSVYPVGRFTVGSKELLTWNRTSTRAFLTTYDAQFKRYIEPGDNKLPTDTTVIEYYLYSYWVRHNMDAYSTYASMREVAETAETAEPAAETAAKAAQLATEPTAKPATESAGAL
jgi:hypothetical protein